MQIKSLMLLVSLTAGTLAAGQITGRVFDPSRALIPNAQVKVVNLATGATLSTLTAEDGSYHVGPLPDGRYSVEVMVPGLVAFRRTTQLDNGKDAPVNAILQLGHIQENIEVAAQGTPKAQQNPPSRIRVGGNVQAAKIIYKVNPAYPKKAKEEGRQGSVLMQAEILKDGTVGSLSLLPGAEPDLAEASLEAVKQWRYSPTLLNGEPVEVATEIQVNFTLAQ